MLQAHEIKKEPTNSSGNKKSSVCTCKKKKKSNENSKSQRQVLVNFGLSRKKVFTLNGKVSLLDQFTAYVLSEPAFSALLKDSYVVFQEFNEKFGSWVDVEQNHDFEDGVVLTAVFFPQSIERDDANPGSIRKSEKDTQHKNIIEIELSEDDSDKSEENEERESVDNSHRPDENHCAEQKKNELKKDKTIEEKDNSKDTSEKQTNGHSKLKKQKKSSLGESHLESSNESNKQTKKMKKSSSSGNFEVRSPEQPALPPIANGTVNHDAPHTDNTSPRSFSKEMSGQNGSTVSQYQLQRFRRTQDPVQDLQRLCFNMKWPNPVYDIKENALGYTCKVLVNDRIYFARHTNSEALVEIAADKVLNVLKPHDKNYVHRYHQRPYENRYNYMPRR